MNRSTVDTWKQSENWDKASPIDTVAMTIEMRANALVAKEKKEPGDYKEIDLLMRQLERSARLRKYAETGKESDLNPNIEARNAAPKKKQARNTFSDEQIGKIGEQRTRNILKSRQIGATWYFAREALVDALNTGRNQTPCVRPEVRISRDLGPHDIPAIGIGLMSIKYATLMYF